MNPYYADERATLYRGDATAVLRDLPDDSVDAVVTDPPYKLSQEYGATTDPDNLVAVASIWPIAAEALRLTKPGGVCALFYDTRILPLALEAMRGVGWKYIRALTLYRRWGQASVLAGWMSTSDFVLIFSKPGGRPEFYGDVRHDVYVRDKAEPIFYGHPAQKPLGDCRHLVRNVCRPGGVTLDPYMGSGTTGVAAVIEGRRFVGVEIAPEHAATAERRIRTAEGQTVADGAQTAFDFDGLSA